MEPALTKDQLQIILTKLLRLNPARPDLANRTFARRWRRLHQQLQPMPGPTPVPGEPAPETNFTTEIDHRPQVRPTHSLIASLPLSQYLVKPGGKLYLSIFLLYYHQNASRYFQKQLIIITKDIFAKNLTFFH